MAAASRNASVGSEPPTFGGGDGGNESWTVLADPEGNEFCVIRPKTTLID